MFNQYRLKMDKKQLVFSKLKPKAKAYGFNVKELKGIAAKIADNLTSEDDASEEDVNAEIDTQIDAVLPYLSFAQSQANRLLDEWKKKNPVADIDDDDDDDDDEPSKGKLSKNVTTKSKKTKTEDEEPAWFKAYREMVDERFAKMDGEKTSNSRKAKLEALLKDTGTFGTRTLKSFTKMSFNDDDEFDEFYAEVEADLKAFNQERADAGLSAMGNPPGAVKGGKKEEIEVLTDDEVKALANL